jgi:hypothetical protein
MPNQYGQNKLKPVTSGPHAGQTPKLVEYTPGVQRWVWDDGVPLNEMEIQEAGVTNWDAGRAIDELGVSLGFNPLLVGADTAGASLDTSGADRQRENMEGFIASLQQQAATGSGSWEKTLAEGTQRTKAMAQSLGQSDPTAGYGASLMNIGNAQASADQRAVGTGEELRAQSKLDAEGQLFDLLGGQAQGDIASSAEQQRVERQRRLANQASIDQTRKNREGTEKAITGALGMGMSDGGEVPGRAEVFGNDERNDTKAAMLSPGEIVIPRDVAMSPDAPARAAEFVAAVKAGYDPQAQGGDPQKFAEGGGLDQGSFSDAVNPGYLIEPHIGRQIQYDQLRDKHGAGGGGELDLTQYNQTAGQQDALAALFAGDAAGMGASVANVRRERAMDQVSAGAGAVAQPGALQRAVEAGSSASADAAATKAGEQSRGQQNYGRAIAQRRGEEMQVASAQQQAAWEKTLADLGLSLDSQAQLRGSIAGAGQAAAAFSGMGRGGGSHSGGGAEAGSLGGTHDTGSFGSGHEGHGGAETEHGESNDELNYAEGGLVARGPRGEKLETDREYIARRAAEQQSDEDDAEEYERTPEQQTAHKALAPVREAGAAAQQKNRGNKNMQRIAEFAQKLGASLPRFAEGGQVPVMIPPPAPGGGYGRDNPGVAGGLEAAFLRAQEQRAIEEGQRGATLPFTLVGGPDDAAPNPAFKSPPGSDRFLGPGFDAPVVNVEQRRLADAKRLELGITPRKETAAPAQPDQPPAPAMKPSGGPGIAIPKPETLERGFADNEAQLAAQQQGEAEAAKARAEVAGIEARETAATAAALRMKEAQDRARQKTDEAFTRWQAAQDEFSRIDTNVDPGRYWADRTTGQKVTGVIGLVLGALGAGPDGINRAAVMMNQAIDRDIAAQKEAVELRLRKGGHKLEGAKTYYAMARESGLDDIAATDAAKAAALDAAALRAEKMVAATNEPMAKAKAQMFSAALRQGALDKREAAKQRTFENQIQLGTLAVHQQTAAATSAAAMAGGKDAVKDLREAKASYDKMAGTVARLKALIGDTNVVTEKVGSKAATMETLAGDLLLQVKDAEKLGALDKGSIAVAEQIIGDPTATFTLDSTKVAKLNALLEQARAKVAAAGGAR